MPSGFLKTTAMTASLALACMTLAACDTTPKVSVLQSDTVQVIPGSTYAWAPADRPGSGDPRLDNDIIQARIRTAVDTALQAKGFRLTDPATATLLVRYHIGLQNRTETRVDTFGGPPPMACGIRGCIGGFGWGMYGAPMDVDVRNINYVEGTVMLDLVDRASGKLAWRATSTQRVDQSHAEQAQVNAIFANLVSPLP